MNILRTKMKSATEQPWSFLELPCLMTTKKMMMVKKTLKKAKRQMAIQHPVLLIHLLTIHLTRTKQKAKVQTVIPAIRQSLLTTIQFRIQAVLPPGRNQLTKMQANRPAIRQSLLTAIRLRIQTTPLTSHQTNQKTRMMRMTAMKRAMALTVKRMMLPMKAAAQKILMRNRWMKRLQKPSRTCLMTCMTFRNTMLQKMMQNVRKSSRKKLKIFQSRKQKDFLKKKLKVYARSMTMTLTLESKSVTIRLI